MLKPVGYEHDDVSNLSSESQGEGDFLTLGHPRHLRNRPLMPDQLMLRKGLLFRCSAAALAGAVLGIYYGSLFLAVAFLIIYRIVSGQSPDPSERHQKQLLFFSSLVILSGIVCFFLRRNWFMHLPSIAKIPIYALLGTSVAFSLTFTLVDIVNILIGVFQSSVAKPLVQSIGQVRLVVSMALLMGAIFGTTFGVMRVEEEVSYHARLALLREEHYCFPIGGILGALLLVQIFFLGSDLCRGYIKRLPCPNCRQALLMNTSD